MGKYKKCPRCELNYILEEEALCIVCKAQLHIGGIRLLEDDEEESMDKCPVCKINILEYGEEICPSCKRNQEKQLFAKEEEDDDVGEDWRTYIDDEPPAVDDEIEIPLSEIAEEEEWSDSTDEEEFIDNSNDEDDFEYVDPLEDFDDYADDEEDDDDDDISD